MEKPKEIAAASIAWGETQHRVLLLLSKLLVVVSMLWLGSQPLMPKTQVRRRLGKRWRSLLQVVNIIFITYLSFKHNCSRLIVYVATASISEDSIASQYNPTLEDMAGYLWWKKHVARNKCDLSGPAGKEPCKLSETDTADHLVLSLCIWFPWNLAFFYLLHICMYH